MADPLASLRSLPPELVAEAQDRETWRRAVAKMAYEHRAELASMTSALHHLAIQADPFVALVAAHLLIEGIMCASAKLVEFGMLNAAVQDYAREATEQAQDWARAKPPG